MKKIAFPLIFLLATSLACQEGRNRQATNQQEIPAQFTSLESETESYSENFNEYWYKGEAEISSYKLEQARYGEIHEGHAVLVYVTEDFSKIKQVKLDNAGSAGADRVPILKLNLTKKFNTGIYPYSIMQSIFTPVEVDKHPHSLKTTMSSQEWCGHVFAQLNNRKDHYELSSYSYFESEGDVHKQLEKVLLEDELWNKIRINPAELPIGKVKLIPSVIHSRLRHRALKTEEANI
ncbi:MAG: septum formation inhibitor Maf, partial [Bacteroidota bacterium]